MNKVVRNEKKKRKFKGINIGGEKNKADHNININNNNSSNFDCLWLKKKKFLKKVKLIVKRWKIRWIQMIWKILQMRRI